MYIVIYSVEFLLEFNQYHTIYQTVFKTLQSFVMKKRIIFPNPDWQLRNVLLSVKKLMMNVFGNSISDKYINDFQVMKWL